MEILKTYVIINLDGQRYELKFIGKVPTDADIQSVVTEISKPPPPMNQCPMNNPKCPLYQGMVK